MSSRFGGINFNLMRAIELFQDMNHRDMDVTAPPSSRDFYKERQVAERLDELLGQLIDEGLFDDCDLREVGSSDDEEDDGIIRSPSTPKSEGFDYDEGLSSNDDRASKESFTGRFKRYVQRILPGIRHQPSSSNGSGRNDDEEELDSEESSEESGRSGSRSLNSGRSKSSSGSHLTASTRSSGSEPNNSDVVYPHSHRHKHDHVGPHHHHTHRNGHMHTYHNHADELSDDHMPGLDEEDYDSHGLSESYPSEEVETLESTPRLNRSKRASLSRRSATSSDRARTRSGSRSSRSSRR